MTTVSDILNFMNTIAPPNRQEKWDRAGLNCGHLNAAVTKILVALDPFMESCREAKAFGAELLVTHHTLLWDGGFITDRDPVGANALFLIENGIAHINAHTSLDLANGGVNDALAAKLGLSNVQIVEPMTDGGESYGLLRMGTVEEQSLESFLGHVKNALNCDGLRYVNCGKPVRRVAVCGGSGMGELAAVVAAGCDTYVTGDVKYNSFREAYDAGINVIDAGHFHTENPVVAVLAEKMSAAFPEIQVKISQTNWDRMKFY